MKKVISILLFALAALSLCSAQTVFNSREAGVFNAAAYNWTDRITISTGNSTTGSATITLQWGSVTLQDGRELAPFAVGAPITVGTGSTVETVTPTSVSSCTIGRFANNYQTCNITASFSNVHGTGEPAASGTAGLQEAINDAFLNTVKAPGIGGTVVVDKAWATGGGTGAMLAAALPYSNVSILDVRGSTPAFWSVQQTAATFLAVPATLTAVTALPSATPVGAYTTGTYHLCAAYVDIAGQVGACSLDFSEAGLATGSFIFSPLAASPGAVGAVFYISLTGGTYSLSYQVPLTSSVCTLTLLETVTPACAVANATYGQSGATATVTALTVSTSPVDMQLGGVSGTLLTGNPNGRTTYGYVAGSHFGAQGIPTVNLAFTAGGIGSATPIAIGTVNFPAGVLNQVGKTIRVCGKELNTDVNSTVQNINIYWDAPGSNVAGSPVQIASLAATVGPGTAATYTGNMCWSGTTTVSGAGATAGSILGGFSLFNYYLSATPAAIMVGGDTKTAAVASLNLAGTAGFENRLSIVHTNTTGNATPQLVNLTIEVL
jgi:hypothetical protein